MPGLTGGIARMLSRHFIFGLKNDILMVMKNTPGKVEKVVKTSDDMENENLQKLRDVFPTFVKDGVIDFDAFQAFFKKEGILAGAEKYGLSWAGKSRAFGDIRRLATSTLTPQQKESKNWDTTENIFIEGENLEVLKLLQKKYANPGKIKMIYIDPPYNTGKDFIYTDNFTENKKDYYERTGQNCGGIKLTSNPESNGRYHSDWLTMMYPRLFLARNLLCDDGVIFVSIDDHEVANLRMIMDEIFGEENFVSQLIWKNKKGGGNDAKFVAIEHEYILMYAKSTDELENLFHAYTEDYIERYKEEDEKGKFFWDTFRRKTGKQYYAIHCPDGTVLENDEHGNPLSWLRSENRFKQDLKDGEIR
ncbi:MAG: site-specific DNA-methyltransferase, partial [Minisyncoccia bacterium]